MCVVGEMTVKFISHFSWSQTARATWLDAGDEPHFAAA
jgi:hypothetical protein